MKDTAINRYTLRLEATNRPDMPARCVATSTNSDSTAEAWLTLVQTNALLSALYGNEQSIVDTVERQIGDSGYADLVAQPGGKMGDRLVVSAEELVRFGFSRDELRPKGSCMAEHTIELFDQVNIAGEAGDWTIVGTRTNEPKYQVQLGKNAASIKWANSDTLTLVKKAEKTESAPGFYPDKSIMG